MHRATALLAALALAMTGCTAGEHQPTTDPSTTEIGTQTTVPDSTGTTTSASATPVIDHFTAATGGYTPMEVWAAVETQRQEFTRRCVEAEGWTVDESFLAPIPTDLEQPPYFGGVVEMFLDDLDKMDPQYEPAQESEPLPADFWTLLDECSQSAIEAVADPRDVLFEWLQQYEDDMAAEFVASPGHAEAAREFMRCVQATGFDVGDPTEASNQISERAMEIVTQFRQGTIKESEARDALAVLASEEQSMTEAFTPCYEAKVGAEQRVWAVVEQAFLDEHGDVLILGLAEAEESVQSILDTLQDRRRGG